MSYYIEILSIGDDSNSKIEEVAQALNVAQNEFHFALPPERLREDGLVFVQEEYHADRVFDFLNDYRVRAKGKRHYLIGIVDRKLRSAKLSNIFGSHRAQEGLAVVTLRDHQHFADGYRSYLSYYLIRYALSFVAPTLKSHPDTRECMFDRKLNKKDLLLSLKSGGLCIGCKQELEKMFNPEIRTAIGQMIVVMKSMGASGVEDLDARALKGQTEVAILTVREDEFGSVLELLPVRRRAAGKNRFYDYARVTTKRKEELGVAITRCPEQGQGVAGAVTNDMIADFAPSWIFLVGIAGGFPDTEYTLGDVVLSSRVHDFAVSAALEGGVTEYQQQGGPVHKDVEKLLAHLVAMKQDLAEWNSRELVKLERPVEDPPKDAADPRLYGPEEWRQKVQGSIMAHFAGDRASRKPLFKSAPMITGNTLLKDTSLAAGWRESARHACAVEMELGGVYLAARYGGDGNSRVLAIRGISDIVGYKRRPEWTAYACRTAAAFAISLIQSGLIRKHTK